jgi:hypothetical protein
VHTQEISEYPEDVKEEVLRHRIRRFPAFLADGTEWILGWEGNPDGAASQAVAGRGTTEVEV